MCEKCDALQARCRDLAKWLEERGLHHISEEDMDLVNFIASKGVVHIGGIGMLTLENLEGSCASIFLAGYKKGYVVKGLELLL